MFEAVPTGTSSFGVTNIHFRSMLAHFPGPEGSAGHEFDIVGTTNLDTSDVDVGGDHHENALSQSDAALALVEPGVQNPESASRDPLFFVP